jgi:hypothetical protein
MKNKVSTVKELIAVLEKLPNKNLPVYFRSKYTGNVLWCDEHPIHLPGIGEMVDNNDKIDRVVFLY